MTPNWDDMLHELSKYHCTCGAGGSLACDSSCLGDTTPDIVYEALRTIIKTLRDHDTKKTHKEV